jgi:hypothetical protein
MTMTTVEEFIEHHGVKGMHWGIRNENKFVGKGTSSSFKVDETPWSAYKESMYSPEQWHVACLIHNHSGPPTSKSQCKLPIKTPKGVVNRHGVYSAAAALAGARGGVNASAEQKNSAAKTLLNLYSKMNVKPPLSLSAKHGMTIDEFIEHYGKRGMHWGIHTEKDFFKTGTKKARSTSSEAKRVQVLRRKHPSSLTNKQLKTVNERMNLEQQFKRLNPNKIQSGRRTAEEIMATVGVVFTAYAMSQTPLGKAAIAAGRKAIGR